MDADFILSFFAGAMVLTGFWCLLAWALLRLVRLQHPGWRFVILLAPLFAAFLARLRLSPDMKAEALLLCVGVALVLLTHDAYRYRRFRRLAMEGAAQSPALQAQVDRLARRLNIRPPCALVSKNPGLVPFACGWRRPYVMVPEPLLAVLKRDEMNALLAHELAHLFRRDGLRKWLLQVLARLAFFNPLACFPVRWLALEMERSCDSMAAMLTGKPGAVAQALLKVEGYLAARRRQTAALALPTTVSRVDCQLATRIQSLAQPNKTETSLGALVKIAFILAIFVAVCFQPADLWLALLRAA